MDADETGMGDLAESTRGVPEPATIPTTSTATPAITLALIDGKILCTTSLMQWNRPRPSGECPTSSMYVVQQSRTGRRNVTAYTHCLQGDCPSIELASMLA